MKLGIIFGSVLCLWVDEEIQVEIDLSLEIKYVL